ncbi:unnamed protein product [Alopecurus aequalis]
MEAPRRAPATGGGEDPSPAASESNSTSTEESQWLATLSEPELVRHAPPLIISPSTFFCPPACFILLPNERFHGGGGVQDFLISLKMLAVKRAETAGRPHLADAFDLRTLRALGIVLLESFKERLKETSVDPAILDNLALTRDSDVNASDSGSDSEVFRSRKYQPTANSVKKKRKMHDR